MSHRSASSRNGISTIHDADIQYAREKNVKIKLVAQVVKGKATNTFHDVRHAGVRDARQVYLTASTTE